MEQAERFKQLLHLMNQLCKKSDRCGETTIQKMIYFIMKAKLLPFDYEYTLYNYGPYSFSLRDDLTVMEESRIVFKEPDPSGYGFNYIPNEEMEFVKKALEDKRFQSKVDLLINQFREIPAKRLGLLATFMYVYDKHDGKISDDALIESVMQIKPMFNVFEIKNTLERYNNLFTGNYGDFLSEIPD